MALPRTLSLLALLACAALPAQRPVTVPEAVPFTSPAEPGPTGPIRLDVLVEGKEGKQETPITGLTRQDFTISDNKTPRPITSFQAVTSATVSPTQVTIVLDAVNASYTLVSTARQQLSKFLRRNEGHLAQPTRLAILTDKGLQIQSAYTQDGNSLASSLDNTDIGLRILRRSSGFFGADERNQISLSSLGRLVLSERDQPGRKLVIFISPGWPLLSGPAVELTSKQRQRVFDQIVNLSTQLRQARVTLYSANPIGAGEDVGRTFYYKDFVKGVSSPSVADIGDLSLQVLSEQTGGRVLTSSNDLAQMLQTAVADASAFYELTFDPPLAHHPNEFHRIDIQIDRPNLSVRTLQGYYNQP